MKRKLRREREGYGFLHQTCKMKMGRAVGLAELLAAPPFLASTSSSTNVDTNLSNAHVAGSWLDNFNFPALEFGQLQARSCPWQGFAPRPRHQRRRPCATAMEALASVKETLFIALIHGYWILGETCPDFRFRGGEDTFGDLPAVARNACILANVRHYDRT